MAYITERFSGTITTASNAVVIGPIDISEYDRYSISFFNNASACMTQLQILASVGRPLNSTESALYVSANTTIIPFPSGLNTSAAGRFITSAIDNSYRYLKITGHTTATGSHVDGLQVWIGGHRRR